MHSLDEQLFMTLNFDGGAAFDRMMLVISGTAMWLPLYALILYLVWRRGGWRSLLIFTALMLGALVLSDMVAGIFKHNGVLGGLLPDFTPRPRPMFTPELEGLLISPDSLAALRRAALPAMEWQVHVPQEALGGLYGTVSAHAATIVALAVLSASVIRRPWFTTLMIVSTVAICYSRTRERPPQQIDRVVLAQVDARVAALWCYRRLTKKKELR